jgi:hypothetical protein
MKNRYGTDGMTYGATINTSNGNIEIEENEIDEDQLGTDNQQGLNRSTTGTNFNKDEMQYLNKKFFELSK